jgi:signal transduction histidine kinase
VHEPQSPIQQPNVNATQETVVPGSNNPSLWTTNAVDFHADVGAITRINAVPRLLEVICRTTGMGFAAVARVTESRWVCCAVRDEIHFGLQAGDELKLESTICNEIRLDHEAVVIEEVAKDQFYNRHPTPVIYGFQSYISVPIVRSDGTFFGTLCAIDPRPARVKRPEIIGMFKLFAELIATHLDASQQIALGEADLLSERTASELREQFIAVLGHDLRNPLASIAAGARLLRKRLLDEDDVEILGLMQGSVLRMSGLIDDVMDFARGRLGGGLTLDRNTDEPLEPALKQVIAELLAGWPDRTIDLQFGLDDPINCDRARVAQLFSNLLGNALTYGAPDKPVQVVARTFDDSFELSVGNAGDPILPEAMERLFQPFTRGSARPKQQGLGLGLYIASEIARAHGGTLTVNSKDDRTLFMFRMPTNRPDKSGSRHIFPE